VSRRPPADWRSRREPPPRRPPRRRAPRRLALAVEGLAGGLEPATLLARAQRAWPQAVGAEVAAAGRPTAERDGVLTVTCADSVWSAELQMMGPQLAERLNEALGEPLVSGLRCRTG
jgi:predicted nucleic acid-binding Zn ribbon protein